MCEVTNVLCASHFGHICATSESQVTNVLHVSCRSEMCLRKSLATNVLHASQVTNVLHVSRRSQICYM